jgi:hypothetical protein
LKKPKPAIVLLALALRGIRLDMGLKYVLVVPFAVGLAFLLDMLSRDCYLPGIFCEFRESEVGGKR